MGLIISFRVSGHLVCSAGACNKMARQNSSWKLGEEKRPIFKAAVVGGRYATKPASPIGLTLHQHLGWKLTNSWSMHTSWLIVGRQLTKCWSSVKSDEQDSIDQDVDWVQIKMSMKVIDLLWPSAPSSLFQKVAFWQPIIVKWSP